MSDRIVVSAVGAVVEINVSELDKSAKQRIRSAWRDALLPGATVSDVTVEPRRKRGEAVMMASLSTDVTLAALGHRRGEIWMLHAAGLADERGHVVALCAPSGTGKTTAARHLSQRYSYVSDEAVGIDSQGGVVSYRKPLSIIDAEAVKTQIAVSEFAPRHPLNPTLRLSKIVVLDRSDDGPEHPEVTDLELGAALTLLAPQSSYLGEMRAALRTIDSLLTATGGAVRVRYREVHALDDIIDDLMQTTPPSNPLSPRAAVPANPSHLPSGSASEPHFRGAALDALDLSNGRIAVLQSGSAGGEIRILDGIAPSLWRAADGVSVETLRDAVLAEHGAPEDSDAEELVQQAVHVLHKSGVLAEHPAWRINDGFAWTASSTRAALLKVTQETSEPVVLEGSAQAIWDVLAKRITLSEPELVRTISAHFDVDPAAVADDITGLLHELSELGAVIQV